MMHEVDYEDMMTDILRDLDFFTKVTNHDKDMLEDYAYRLFRGCIHDKEITVEMLMMKLVRMIHSYRMHETTNMLQRFTKPTHKMYAKDAPKRREAFKKKLQEIYELMGGEYGTVAGNALKEVLNIPYNEPDRFLQERDFVRLPNSTDKGLIEEYLRRINPKTDREQDTSSIIDSFMSDLKNTK